jgi:putative tricarboxylic transport membrane protein
MGALMSINYRAWADLIAALSCGVAALVLSNHIVQNPELAQTMSRGIATPLTWPKIMLYGVVIFSLGWAIQVGFALYKEYHNHKPTKVDPEDEALEFGDVGFEHHALAYPPLPVVLGILLALAYVFVIPWLGFTLATVAFLVLWFLVGGIRSPTQIGLVTILGTIIILYVFVKLALMPLDRGVGMLNEFTIALFRILGIY